MHAEHLTLASDGDVWRSLARAPFPRAAGAEKKCGRVRLDHGRHGFQLEAFLRQLAPRMHSPAMATLNKAIQKVEQMMELLESELRFFSSRGRTLRRSYLMVVLDE